MNSGKEAKKEASKKKVSTKKKAVKPDKTKEQLKKMRLDYDGLNDKYLRLYSEFDNYRKRTLKERSDLLKNASEEMVAQLLPVLDDFERALQALDMPSNKNGESHKEGMSLIYNKLRGLLVQKGLEPIEAIGSVFDVDYHDAVTNIPAPSDDLKGKVVDEVEKGYMLNGKVIRFSKVIVGK